ncbi:serine carboxypeptidase-like 51 [Zingiber officinale]|uniref:serine carboxypeptidase-like 51 n=1 Tax=Zingiber officinale TaxID=94328 RepID=UPI001C4D0C0C|nr:serine carboxypeptidase-like 51 [Zingiber officinale]
MCLEFNIEKLQLLEADKKKIMQEYERKQKQVGIRSLHGPLRLTTQRRSAWRRWNLTPWPTILWLQGGPSASGVGIGNFQEIGPLDTNLKPCNSTWLQKADLLFVENPVGTGFSFVEEESLLAKSDWEAAVDLTALLKKLYNGNTTMQQRNNPLFVVAESYGGRFAVTTTLSVLHVIRAGKLKLKLGGVALGNSWMSPEDYVLSWGPLLQDMSRLDAKDAEKSNSMARVIKEEIDNGELANATNTWRVLKYFISARSNRVSFHNFLLDDGMDPITQMLTTKTYSSYLSSQSSTSVDLPRFMNGVIREKLKIIPEHVKWQERSDLVFDYFSNGFMQPRIKEVDRLLSLGITVAIYNGQVDLICSNKGTHAWLQKLKWKGLKKFTNTPRSPLYCNSEEAGVTKGFFKSYQNLQFYWILRAGHFVPVDQPCVALQMIANLTQSPTTSYFRLEEEEEEKEEEE